MSQLKRTGVGPAQRTRLLQEVGGACPFCGLEMIGSLQIHHVDRDPQNTVDENLIATCASCHEQLTRQLIPDSDVVWRKRALQHGIHPVTKEKPEMSVSNTDNRGGVIAQHIGKVEIRNQEKTSPIILPGSIGASPRHYNYVEYLIKQLTEFRQAGASFGQKRKGKIHSGGTRAILANELGGLPKDQLLACFEEVVVTLKNKIDRTALGRRNHARGIRNYHAFEEHGTGRKA